MKRPSGDQAGLESRAGSVVRRNGSPGLSIPVTFGFSLDDYYIDESGDDDFFGYATVGADVAIPLGSGNFGEWTMNVGGNLLFLGSAAEAANGGDDNEAYGYIGVSFSF